MPHLPVTHVGSKRCTNIVIDVISPIEATEKSAVALFMGDTAPKLGRFHDRFVRSKGRWLFATTWQSQLLISRGRHTTKQA